MDKNIVYKLLTKEELLKIKNKVNEELSKNIGKKNRNKF